MKPVSGNSAQRRPNSPNQRPRTEIPSRSVFGFPVSSNQFNVLQASDPAMSTSQVQLQDRLIDQGGQDWQDNELQEEMLDREQQQMREFFILYH